MGDETNETRELFREVLLNSDDILDEDVYEKVWMAFGDQKDLDMARLIRQGRIHD